MNFLRKYIKVISVFLLINTINYLFFPSLTWALTSGPANPDYTSFEPVDATDMVDLLSGDFTYTMPLLEVPGPAGSYPISMAYHAGIRPDQEASWVGLGWSLNPGAINRIVNGHPDDHKGVNTTTRAYWKGGKVTEKQIGVSVGLPGDVVSIGAGAIYAENTYTNKRGWGAYGDVSVRYGPVDGAAKGSLGLGLRYDPVNGFKGSINNGIGIGASVNNLQGSAKVAIHTNFNGQSSMGFTGGINADIVENSRAAGLSLLDVNINSRSGNGVVSVGGFNASIDNRTAGKISSSTSVTGISIPIPIEGLPLWINYSKSTYRFWSDESDGVTTNGALYFDDGMPTEADLEDNDYDIYSLVDQEFIDKNLDDPDKVMGGSFPEYDSYQVTGQGLAGFIRPYHYKQHLMRQNKGDEVIHKPTGYNDPTKVHFRFVGDFSNRHEYNPVNFSTSSNDPLNYSFTGNSITGTSGNEGFIDNKLVGSREIRHYTNAQINLGQTDFFIENNASGFDRSVAATKYGDQIGGYVITNESGVSYHYTLPAYSYGEYQESQKINEVTNFNNFRRPEGYAYTWHLTAITGPDYVDRGGGANGSDPDGYLGEDDWGYWVNFDYGKWTETYRWRNPGTNFNKDLDAEFQNFSLGIREIYYLDAISTKTHTALFIKEVREDNRGIALPDSRSFHPDLTYSSSSSSFHDQTITASYKYGYFHNYKTNKNSSLDVNPGDPGYHQTKIMATKTYSASFVSTPSLKLSKILLLQNKDISNMDKSEGDDLLWESSNFEQIGCIVNGSDELHLCSSSDPLANKDSDEIFGTFGFIYKGSNVFEQSDLDKSDFLNKSLRSVIFETDYSLAKGTINSWDQSGNPSGKLTLKKVIFKGKAGNGFLPPTSFQYNYENPLLGSGIINGNTLEGASMGIAQVGDIININDGFAYAVITGQDDNDYTIQKIGSVDLPTGSVNWSKSKNPPYDPQAYDIWWMYKPDVDESLLNESETLARRVTDISANNQDVWSMRKIKSPLGTSIEVNYEVDSYEEVKLISKSLVNIGNVEKVSNSKLRIYITSDLDLASIFKKNDEINVSLKTVYNYTGSNYSWADTKPSGDWYPRKYFFNVLNIDRLDLRSHNIAPITGEVVIDVIGSNYIEVLSSSLISKIEGLKRCREYDFIVLEDSQLYPLNKNTKSRFAFDYEFSGWPDYIYGGYVNTSNNQIQNGGGVRVHSISLLNNSSVSETRYEYSQSSTSFEPFVILPPIVNADIANDPKIDQEAVKNVVKLCAYDLIGSLAKNTRELPAPGVIYGRVDVKEYRNSNKIPGSMRYEFQSFEEGMVGIDAVSEFIETEDNERTYYGDPNTSDDNHNYQRKNSKTLSLKNFTSGIGNLKSMISLDIYGNKLSEVKHHYLYDDLSGDSFQNYRTKYKSLIGQYNNQGLVEETFVDARFAKQDNGDYHLIGTVTKREQYPNIQTGTTSINYSTGAISGSRNLAFDMYSGQLLSSVSKDAKGILTKSDIRPAYKRYALMGPKGQSANFKNMLTQVAEQNQTFLNSIGSSININIGYTTSADNWYIFDAFGDFGVNDILSFEISGKKYFAVRGTTLANGNVSIRFIGASPIKPTSDGILASGVTAYLNDSAGLFSASATTWTNNFKRLEPGGYLNNGTHDTWIKSASHNWIGDGNPNNVNLDGTYKLNAFTDFDYSNGALNTGWQKNSDITLYDVYSHALEATDINGNYAATRFDTKQERVVATAANARYDEFLHASTLNTPDFEVYNVLPAMTGHSAGGAFGVQYNGKVGFKLEATSGVDLHKKYLLSYWVLGTSQSIYYYLKPYYRINNGAFVDVTEISGFPKRSVSTDQNSWHLHQAIISIPVSTPLSVLEIGCHGIGGSNTLATVDDLRVQPLDASVIAYTYNQWGELIEVIDNQNLITRYEYDDLGRLKSVHREALGHGLVKVSENEIHYANQN